MTCILTDQAPSQVDCFYSTDTASERRHSAQKYHLRAKQAHLGGGNEIKQGTLEFSQLLTAICGAQAVQYWSRKIIEPQPKHK